MIKAVIFDLDGVIVSTDEYHYLAWKYLADELGIPFDRELNHKLRGVSRLDSLKIILQHSNVDFADHDLDELTDKKNSYYKNMLQELSARSILPGAKELIESLRSVKIKIAVASSSKNAKTILSMIKLFDKFDVITDGNDIENSKPDPEIFLLTSKRLNVPPEDCVVIEDAEAGIEAAKKSGMKQIGIGTNESLPNADIIKKDLSEISLNFILSL